MARRLSPEKAREAALWKTARLDRAGTRWRRTGWALERREERGSVLDWCLCGLFAGVLFFAQMCVDEAPSPPRRITDGLLVPHEVDHAR